MTGMKGYLRDPKHYVEWLEEYGARIIDTHLSIIQWRIQFKDAADAVAFRLKFGI
jgi:hypothetical protein